MKITRVRLTSVRTRRYTLQQVSDHVLVEIDSAEGITGFGEISDFEPTPFLMVDLKAMEAAMNSAFVGEDARQFSRVESILDKFCGSPAKEARHVRAGIEIAIYDMVGKLFNCPVSHLLGGRHRDRIQSCFPIWSSKSMAEVEVNLGRAEHFVQRGFNVMRVYVGNNWEADEAFLAGIRAKFGQTLTIKALDFGGNRIHWKEAVAFIKRVQHYGFQMVESPSMGRDDLQGLRNVRSRVDVPVSEHIMSLPFLLEAIRMEAIDIANVASSYIGGLTRARRAFAICDAAHLQCLVGTTQELSLATAALSHLAASLPNLHYACDPMGPEQVYIDDIAVESVRYEKGYLMVPEGPGLGVVPDPDKINALRAPLQT